MAKRQSLVAWLQRARAGEGGTFILLGEGLNGKGTQPVQSWPSDMVADRPRDLEREIWDAAQLDTDATGAACTYYLEGRTADGAVKASLRIRVEPTDSGAVDEDATPAGQIRQQMRHSEVMMQTMVRHQAAMLEAVTGITTQLAAMLQAERAARAEERAEVDAAREQLAHDAANEDARMMRYVEAIRPIAEPLVKQLADAAEKQKGKSK